MQRIKSSGDKLLVCIDKIAVKEFCDAIPGELKNCHVKLNEQKYHGIPKSIEENFDLDMFKGYDGMINAKRIGKSMVVKVTFTHEITLSNALRMA